MNKMKKFISALLCMSLLFAAAVIPNTAVADSADFNVEQITWTDENGKSITANAVSGFKDGVDTTKYKDLVIPNTVNGVKITAIADGAFSGGGFDSITVPSGIEFIGVAAFYNSTVKKVTIADSVRAINYNAFSGCSEMTEIKLSANLVSLAEGVFRGCSKITSIDLPKKLKSIGYSCFYLCEKLQSIVLPEGLTELGYNAFESCYDLTSVTLPSTLKVIPESAFYGCVELKSIDIPSGCTTISKLAFDRCRNLETINIPDSVTHIYEDAFYGTAFLNNKITAVSGNQGCIYAGKVMCMYYVNEYQNITSADVTSVSIKEGTLGISSSAFKNFINLNSVSLPQSLKTIEYEAFMGCSSLTTIDIPANVDYIGYYAFRDCTSLRNINFASQNSLRNMGSHVFDNTAWYNSQPDGIVYIGNVAYSYKGTPPIDKVLSIKSGTKAIASGGFEYLYVAGIKLPDGLETIGDEAFYGCETYPVNTIFIPDSVSYIGNQAFFETDLTVFEVNSGGYSEAVVRKYVDEYNYNGLFSVRVIGSSTMVTTTTTTAPKTTTTTTAKPTGMPGDVNLDNVVNLADVRAAVAAVASGSVGNLSEQAFKNGDVTYDGEFNLADIRKIVGAIASGNFKSLDK